MEKTDRKSGQLREQSVPVSLYIGFREDSIMETAMDILTDRLISTGMTEIEIDHLLARFLQEEAFDYVDYIESHLKEESADSLYS